MKELGLYIHVPFCRSKCTYCDFYSLADRRRISDYRDSLARELEKWRRQLTENAVLSSVYFGGGTPTALGADNLVQVLNEIKKRFPFQGGAEVALEANPNTVNLEDLLCLRQAGFNRISFGVQSAVDQELSALGRTHSCADVRRAVEDARKVGFSNLSADLMLGIPFQTADSLEESVGFLLALDVDHVSAYLLQLEPNTFLYKRRESLSFPGEEETADFYLYTVRRLEAAGLPPYEISNFAKPGHTSRHNLSYWEQKPYLGIGPSAHSFLNGKRFAYPPDLERFIRSSFQQIPDVEPAGEGGDLEEYLLLRLRLADGIRYQAACAAHPDFSEKQDRLLQNATPLEKAGLCDKDETGIRLTPEGFLLSNQCTTALLNGLF